MDEGEVFWQSIKKSNNEPHIKGYWPSTSIRKNITKDIEYYGKSSYLCS